MHSPDRRRFLRQMAGGVTAAAAIPSTLQLRDGESRPSPLLTPTTADEGFWQLVRRQFPLRSGLILMNAANLCPSPYPVIDSVTKLTRDVDSDASFQNRAKFGELREEARRALAEYLSVDADEVAITRNTSEGNNTIVNGLDLGPGDEVVIWDQNHPTNNIAWDVRSRRLGFTVRRVGTPPQPQSDEDLTRPFAEAITPRTRVLAFSHVSNVSGVALPARQLCHLAGENGVFTLVDGAQTFGSIQVDLRQTGCDSYTGSSHKWLVGPKEAGLLYVKRARIEELWASDVGVGWEGALENGARKFENLGQRDDAAVSAMGTAVTFHTTIGAGQVEDRVRTLAAALKEGLRARIPGISFHTPMEPELSAGVVVFAPPSMDTSKLFRTLYSEYDIAGAAMGGDFTGLRLSPHIYNTLEQVDRATEVIESLS